MNTAEALQLVGIVKALCPGQPMTPETPRAWSLVLREASLDDAQQAARTVYLERGSDQELGARRLEPDDILREVKRMRRARVDAAPPFVPSDPDATPQQQALDQRVYYAAAADGRPLPALPPTGTHRLALPGSAPRGGEPRPVGRLRRT